MRLDRGSDPKESQKLFALVELEKAKCGAVVYAERWRPVEIGSHIADVNTIDTGQAIPLWSRQGVAVALASQVLYHPGRHTHLTAQEEASSRAVANGVTLRQRQCSETSVEIWGRRTWEAK